MENFKPNYEELASQVNLLQIEVEKLNKQLGIFKAFADYSYDFEVLMLPSGNFLYVSPSCKMLTGYEDKEFFENSKLLEQIVFLEDKEKYLYNFRKIINFEDEINFEFRLLTKDGKLKWVEQCCGKTYNKENNFIGYRASYRDISKRKEAETELNNTNKLLNEERQLFSHGNIAIFKWRNDTNLSVEYVSENIEEILGYSVDEIKSTEFIFKNIIHKSDLITFTDEINYNISCKHNRFQHNPFRLICKSGKIIWVSNFTIINRNKYGNIVNFLGYIADITKLVESEYALKSSKSQISAILHALPDMMFIQNNKGVYIDYYAPQPEKLYTTPEFFIGKNMTEVLPLELVQNLQQIFEKAIKTQNVQKHEYSIQLQTGLEYFECRVISFEEDKILSIIRNITKRKQAEIALKESEERYKKITATLTDYLYTVKVENGIVTETIHNEACLKITGYSPQEFLSNKYLWINMVLPEKRQLVTERFEKILKAEVFPPIEHRIICKNGEIKWVSDTVIPKYNSNGELISYDGIITDITERKMAEHALKESEEKFRMMVMNNPDLTIFQDELGKTIYINQQAMKVLGHKPETFLGTSFPDFIHQQDSENLFKILEEVKNGKSIENYEYRIFTEKGETNYLSHNAKPVIVNNKFLGVVSSIRNITEQKKFEVALKESEEWYKSLNEVKDKFFSIIAHDLTGPYSNVLRLLSLLQKNLNKYPLSKIEQFVNNIYLSTENAFLLLQSLLLWAKSQRGLLPFNPEEINLKELFKFKIDFFKESANQKKIKIQSDIPENMIVIADSNMLKLILQNLISNAIKFTNENGIIKLQAIETSDNVLISIVDNGIGMDSDTLDKLFKLDSNLTTTGTAGEQGTGLGLILCKEFVDKHSGQITAKSQLGNGSEFSFILPKFRNLE